MVNIVAREAEAEGRPLTEDERKLLAREVTQDSVPAEFHDRILTLVKRIIEREVKTGEIENPRSFNGAIEWAGDMYNPYVVMVADQAHGSQPPPAFRDQVRSPGGMFAVSVIIGALATLAWVIRHIFFPSVSR